MNPNVLPRLRGLYEQAQAGDLRARATVAQWKRLAKAGDTRAQTAYNTLAVLHWKGRDDASFRKAEIFYNRIISREPTALGKLGEIVRRAKMREPQGARAFATLKAIHHMRKASVWVPGPGAPRTGGYDLPYVHRPGVQFGTHGGAPMNVSFVPSYAYGQPRVGSNAVDLQILSDLVGQVVANVNDVPSLKGVLGALENIRNQGMLTPSNLAAARQALGAALAAAGLTQDRALAPAPAPAPAPGGELAPSGFPSGSFSALTMLPLPAPAPARKPSSSPGVIKSLGRTPGMLGVPAKPGYNPVPPPGGPPLQQYRSPQEQAADAMKQAVAKLGLKSKWFGR